MVEQLGAALPSERDGEQRRRVPAPRTWIYRNLTPWRIYARYSDDGTPLDGRSLSDVDTSRRPSRAVDPCAWRGPAVQRGRRAPRHGRVASAGAGRRAAGAERALERAAEPDRQPRPARRRAGLRGLGAALRRLERGAVGVVRRIARRRLGRRPRGGDVPGDPHVSALRPLQDAVLRAEHATKARSLEGIGRGSRFCTFVDSLPRQALEVAVLIGAVVDQPSSGSAWRSTRRRSSTSTCRPRLRRDRSGSTTRSPTSPTWRLRSPAFWQLLVGHVAQWILVSIAALRRRRCTSSSIASGLPPCSGAGCRRCSGSIRPCGRCGDIEAKYGSQIEASFGDLGTGLRVAAARRPALTGDRGDDPARRRLVPRHLDDAGPAARAERGHARAELVWPTAGESFPVPAFFRPDLSLVGYAFLGAYVFTLFHVIRGYQRRDLHPKTYNTVVVRILAAYVMALVVSVVYDGPAAEVMMFFVGFMPQSALVWLREKLSQRHGSVGCGAARRAGAADRARGHRPLRPHAARRGGHQQHRGAGPRRHRRPDEQHAHLRRRARRLDRPGHPLPPRRRRRRRSRQEHAERAERRRRRPVRGSTAGRHARTSFHLRRYGIRTATDLLQAYDQAIRRGGGDHGKEQAEVEALRTALELPSTPENAPISPIQTIIDTLPDEEWFTQIRNWRNPEFGAADSWYWYLDGVGMSPLRAPLPERVKRSKRQFDAYSMAVSNAPDEQPSAREDGDHERETGPTQHSEDHADAADGAGDRPLDAVPAGHGPGGEVRELAHHGRDRAATVGD